MDWKTLYESRVVTAEEALSQIKDGEMIVPSHAAAEPKYLFNKLVEMKDKFHNVGILQGLNIGDAPYASEDCYGHFVINSFFLGKNNRKCLQEGRGEMIPMHFYAQPVAMRDGYVPVDVGLIQVTPPDEEGYVYMGTSCDQTKVIVNKARITIAQVNKKMPHVMGDTRIPVSDIDYFVEYDEDIYELPLITSNDPISEKIGYHISTLIEDGACLQMGQGNVPNAILKFIEDKKDIGIHTEVFSDNLIPLIEKGVVNGMKKNIDQGKIVATFVQGTKDLYEFVDNNPMIQLMPVDYTNDVGVIAKNDNVVAINSATQVDLMGQVVADSIGTKMFSGVGGQQDFIRGAEQSKGGRPIIALPSTAKGGEVSRIVAVFERGTPITTTRNDVHYVVTEYGIADLFGKSINQRADALINIAHPKFREQLRKEFQEYQKSTGQIHVLHD
ncbi:MAG: acetyl-CoA hydrolase/transferase family protein [Firmicutes bacterium]|nr:acetyl-CoA hydrolase/transferase family protein [Bacillota bacterium]